jgi:predicted MFS family arabinose efflux permease
VLGGEVATVLGWRAVFALPVIAAPTALAASTQLPHVTDSRRPQDLREAFVFTLSAAGLLTLVQTPGSHLSPPVVVVLGFLTALAVWLLVRGVRQGRSGFVAGAVRKLKRSPLRFSIATAASLGAANLGMAFLGPLLVSSYHPSWSLLRVGAVLLPGAAIPIATSLRTGAELRKRSPQTVIAVLATISAAGIGAAAAAPGVVPTVIAAGCATAGFAGGQVLLLSLIPALIPRRDVGLTLGLASMLFVLGGAVGAAVAGLLVQVGGLRIALIGTACLALTAMPCLAPKLLGRPAIGLVRDIDAKEEA